MAFKLPEHAASPKFEEYKEKFKEFLILERKNGIISVRMHTDGGPVKWGNGRHNALPEAFHLIGADPENEVMILTSTGPYWMGLAKEGMEEMEETFYYDMVYYDAAKMVENLICDMDFPTIAAVNGPGFHAEISVLCDITICTPDSLFQDGHFLLNCVPGDGQSLTFQHLLGTKRAAYYVYTSKNIDAKTALEWGLVNEIVTRDKLMDRAWELAEMIMQRTRVVRRLTSQIVKRPWKKLLAEDMQFHMAAEAYGARDQAISGVERPGHDFIREMWEKEEKEQEEQNKTD